MHALAYPCCAVESRQVFLCSVLTDTRAVALRASWRRAFAALAARSTCIARCVVQIWLILLPLGLKNSSSAYTLIGYALLAIMLVGRKGWVQCS